MKKTVFHLLLAALALTYIPCCVSCTEENNQEQNNNEGNNNNNNTTPEVEKPKPGTYTFTAPALKGKWEVGDKIYVHGSYAPAAQMITLSAADISADGTTATAELGSVTEYFAAPDGLYAAWPGEAVFQDDGMLEATLIFTDVYRHLGVAYLKGTEFAFVDASSQFKFQAPGYTDYAFCGNQRPGLRTSSFEAEHTSDMTTLAARKTDGYPFLYGKLTDGAASFWFPGTINLKGGFSLYLGKDGEWTKVYTVSEDFKLKAGVISDLGDISASLADYSGPAPKMPEMQEYKKFEVKLTELSGLCLSSDGEFLWGVGDGSELARLDMDGSVLNKASIINTYLDANGKTKTRSLDSEGLSINYDTGDLLIAGEPNHAFCIPADELGNVFNESSYKGVVHLFDIKEAKGYSNAGMEGITYYKDGLVYCGTQTGSDLFLCDLNAQVSEDIYKYTPIVWKKRLVEKFPSITEIGGLCYDPLTDWLWITDSEAKKITALSGDAEQIYGSYSVKMIVNAESIYVDHVHGCIWVGCDNDSSTSHLFRFDFTGLDDAIIK